MPELKNIRFHKLDKYNNAVFIVNGKKEEEKENYEILKKNSELLTEMYQTFLPIYHNTQYKFCTIRFSKNFKFKPEEHCTYDLKYSIRSNSKSDHTSGDTKKFVNCVMKELKFVSRKEIDEGEEIDL